MSDFSAEAREVCRSFFGCQLHSIDQFIAECLRWLAAEGPVTIECHGSPESTGDDDWVVHGEGYTVGDHTLAWALMAAVKTVDYLESEQANGGHAMTGGQDDVQRAIDTDTGAIGSHWDGCWLCHHECAVAKVRAMQREINAYIKHVERFINSMED